MQRKNDLDRIGLFSEMPYMLGDKYDKSAKCKRKYYLKRFSWIFLSCIIHFSGIHKGLEDSTNVSKWSKNQKWSIRPIF